MSDRKKKPTTQNSGVTMPREPLAKVRVWFYNLTICLDFWAWGVRATFQQGLQCCTTDAERRKIENLITSEPKKRDFVMAGEKGSSSWLSFTVLRILPEQEGFPRQLATYFDTTYNWPNPYVCKHRHVGRATQSIIL